MQASWNFYRFDYVKYQTLRPHLRAATQPEAFAAIGEGPEGDAIAEAVEEGTLTLESACNVLVMTLCCPDDPLPIDVSFSRFVAALARRRGAEDAAEILGALVGGGKPVEIWMQDAGGLLGLLTPQETQALHLSYHSLLGLSGHSRRNFASIGRRQRIRRGGLVGMCVRFVRNLFNAGPQPDDLLFLLANLLQEACAHNQGLAIARA